MRQLLDAEEQSDDLTKLPEDIYQNTAVYIHKLRKTVDNNSGDPSSRLAEKQLWLLEGMGKQLLETRLAKVIHTGNARLLLPEEKYVYELSVEFDRIRKKFVDAMDDGQPSIFMLMQKNQMEKMVIVSFTKPLGEIVGFDLKRYGPFKVHDVAKLPAANAEVLISNGNARRVYPADSF